jgi:hypothetical protein
LIDRKDERKWGVGLVFMHVNDKQYEMVFIYQDHNIDAFIVGIKLTFKRPKCCACRTIRGGKAG